VSIARVTMEMFAPASSTAERTRLADRTGLRLLGAVLLTFVVWRGSLFLFDLVGLSLVPSMGACRRQWQLFGKGHELLDGFFRWDAAWYLNIAEAAIPSTTTSRARSRFIPCSHTWRVTSASWSAACRSPG
jgi:hypothetical protein